MRHRNTLALHVVTALVVACSSAPASRSPGCDQGAARACVCTTGGQGAQTCLAGGSFGTCECVVLDARAEDVSPPPDASDVTDAPDAPTAADVTSVDAQGPPSPTDVVTPPADVAAEASLDVALDLPPDLALDAAPDAPDASQDTASEATEDVELRDRPDVVGGDTGAGACAAALAPTLRQMFLGAGAGGSARWPRLMVAGGGIYLLLASDGWRTWHRWEGSTWEARTIPWPGAAPSTVHEVYPLPDGTALFLVPGSSALALLHFDGVSFGAPVQVPATVSSVVGFTRTPDGAMYALSRDDDLTWRLYRNAGAGFDTGQAVPATSSSGRRVTNIVMSALTHGGLVVAFEIEAAATSGTYMVQVLQRSPSGAWSAPQTLPSSSSSSRYGELRVTAMRRGGVLVGAPQSSGAQTFAWASADGERWGAREVLPFGSLVSFDGECLDGAIAVTLRDSSLPTEQLLLVGRGAGGVWGVRFVDDAASAGGFVSFPTAVVGAGGRTCWASRRRGILTTPDVRALCTPG